MTKTNTRGALAPRIASARTGGSGGAVGPLADDHRRHLHGSALTDETIDLAGLGTVANAKGARTVLGRGGVGRALAFPIRDPDRAAGSDTATYRLRPDEPRVRGDKPIKYDQPTKAWLADHGLPSLLVYLPPLTLARIRSHDGTARAVLWTEGEKKALLLDQLGYDAVGLTGVYCFHDIEAKKRGEGLRLHPWLRGLCSTPRDHVICFDSDRVSNKDVGRAEARLAGLLGKLGARAVRIIDYPPSVSSGPNKIGIDDFCMEYGIEATVRLLEGASTATSTIEPEGPAARVGQCSAYRKGPLDGELLVPRSFELHSNGSLWRDGEWVTEHPPFVSRVLRGERDEGFRVELVFLRSSGAWERASVPRRALTAKGTAAAELGRIGVHVTPRSVEGVIDWLSRFERENAERLGCVEVVANGGWHEMDGEYSFVLGREVIRPPKSSAVPTLELDERAASAALVAAITRVGQLSKHIEHLRVAFGIDDVLALAILAGLSPPLLRHLSAPSFVVHLLGPSSRGKTSAQRVSASLWGKPATGEPRSMIASWATTAVGLEEMCVISSGLPLYLDEAGLADDEQRANAAYRIVEGRSKARGAREGGLRGTTTWEVVGISSGEVPLVGARAMAGAHVRVLQRQVDGLGELDGNGVDALTHRARQHYGHVGHAYVKRLVALSDDEWSELRARYGHIREQMAKSARSTLDQRQASSFAVMAVAEHLAAQWFGIGSVDSETTFRIARAEQRIEVEPEDVRAAGVILELLRSNPAAFSRITYRAQVETQPRSGATRFVCASPPQVSRLGFLDAQPEPSLRFRGEAIYLVPGPITARLSEAKLSLDVVAREWGKRGILALPARTAGRSVGKTVRVSITEDGVKSRMRVLAVDRAELEALAGFDDAEVADGEP